MAKSKKRLVKTDHAEEIKQKENERKQEEKLNRTNRFVELIDIIRHATSQSQKEKAFDEIATMMKTKILQLSYKMHISGYQIEDLTQEALVALCFKAIKDYDKTRSNIVEVSPFDSFAVLCIRRHLSTKYKNSFQGKQKVLNNAISLDQDRSNGNSDEGTMSLADVVPFTNVDPVQELEGKENYRVLMAELWQKMSTLEKQVFVLYKQNLSYEEIEEAINRKNMIDKKPVINIKSVDNALSRIKAKAKSVYDQYMKG